jgi:hypothetical protein
MTCPASRSVASISACVDISFAAASPGES